MKRLFAIVLLCIHLFSIGGYSLLFQYYIHKSDVQIVKEIFDNKINDAKLIELKIPVYMPTIQDWSDYEVIAGQIQLKDAYYNYVRLRMTRDTMYFICIPNTVKTKLVINSNIITAKQLADVPLSKKGHESSAKRLTTLGDYTVQAYNYEYTDFETTVKKESRTEKLVLSVPFVSSPGKPPNTLS
ncbi:MAG TPA: hypothetical protein VHA56_13820 [Mucilaginibacter sp.]|nr:hypothetical protein [Mucilaginibacter sp.]